MNLFGEPDPAPPELEAETVVAVVARTPGWILFANRHGPQGYHKVKTVGVGGTLVARCGLVGRKVEEAQRSIIECDDCRDL